MKKRLLVEDNIPAIEDLLDKESQRLEKLKVLKKNKKLNLGDKVSAKELEELFPNICKEVDEFLGIQEGKVPKFEYFDLMKPGLKTTPLLSLYVLSTLFTAGNLIYFFASQNSDISYLQDAAVGAMFFSFAKVLHSLETSNYNLGSQKITLEKLPRTKLITTAGHEYTHSVQDINGLASKKYSIFVEGHAIGVEKYLAEKYKEREDNEAFLYGIMESTVGEFKSAYQWMCKNLGKTPKKSLLKIKTIKDDYEGLKRLIFRNPSSHAIGNALFSIYEAKHGKNIYKEIIHGNFQFV